MKRLICAFVIALAFCVPMVGCSEPGPSPEELRQQLSDYVESPEIMGFNTAFDEYSGLYSAVIEGETAEDPISIDAKVQSLCQDVIDFEDVPEVARESHDELVSAAEALQVASSEMLAAYQSESTDELIEHINNATDAISDVGDHASASADALNDARIELEDE